MKSHSLSPFLSLGFAVMLLLSIAVHPVMAADATKHQLDSFSVEDIQSVTVDELVSDQTVSGFMVSASSSDDIQETRIGKVHIRAKDPMADQHRPDLGEFSASSAATSDMVDAEIAGAIASMSREGYVLTGQTEHRYASQFDSEKFRHIDRAHQALLEVKGLHMDALNPAVLTTREDVTYYFLTNTGTNATRVISVVQMIGPEGEPVGDRKISVSSEHINPEGDGFSASGVIDWGLTGACIAELSFFPYLWVFCLIYVIWSISNESLLLPVSQFSCTPPSGVAPLTIQCTDQSIGASITRWDWDFGDSHGSTKQNPSHTYTMPGVYTITLKVTNDGGSDTRDQPGYTVTAPPANSNIVLFGDTTAFEKSPAGTDYSRLGGSSAIRRDGSLDSFTPAPSLPGNDWVEATYGAAIKKDGTLVTWTPGSSEISATYPATADKMYVDISRFSEGDWLLAITEDSAGETHLELVIEGDRTKHPEISDQLPTGTGWRKISAGNNHALALKSDGALVAWGKNNDHQLELPVDKKYTDISAGRDFSIGLVEAGSSTDTGPDLAVVGNGKDEHHQRSDMTNLLAGRYIAIEAGTTRSAALDHDGTIRWGGQKWTGSELPQGNGYTDIVLGPDYGFAIKESAEEVILSGPISPGKPMEGRKRVSGSTDTPTIPIGSTIEHTDHDITRIFGPDGTQISWVNDKEAMKFVTPRGNTISSNLVHYVPTDSIVDSTTSRKVTVTESGTTRTTTGNNVIFTVLENTGASDNSLMKRTSAPHTPTVPSGACIEGVGCSVVNSAKSHVFLSQPFSEATDYSPIYSVEYRGDNIWEGSLCSRGNDDQCTGEVTAMASNKTGIDVNLSQPVIFIRSFLLPNDLPIALSTISRVNSDGFTYQYSTSAEVSEPVQEIRVISQLFNTQGDQKTLLDQTPVQICHNTASCMASSVFTVPQESGNYSAKGVVTYIPLQTRSRTVSSDLKVKSMSSTSGLKTIPRLSDFTHYKQSCNNWCAVTVAQMISKWWGVTKNQDQIAGTMGLGNQEACHGSTPYQEVDMYYIKSAANGGLNKAHSAWIDFEPLRSWETAREEIEDHKLPLKMGKDGHARAIIGVKKENGKDYLWEDNPGFETTDAARSWIEFSTPTDFVVVRE